VGHRVRICNTGAEIDCRAGVTILQAAFDADVPFPHGCQSGNCGACKARLTAGSVDMKGYATAALTAGERACGLILACRAMPTAPCAVSWIDVDDPPGHPRRVLYATVASIEDATHDIKRITLDIQDDAPFAFSAGQFASVTFGGMPPRDYSMANRPGERRLEFHVRRMAGGMTSRHVATGVAAGDNVRIEGPFGTSYLRESHRGPILAVAGGSGLAPIKSIVEQALARKMPQDIRLYVGARDEADLYLDAHFNALSAAVPNLRYVPVLSDPAGPTARHRGLVHDAIGHDVGGLDGWKAYVAGPPAMVEAVTALLTRRGMRPVDVHADAFYSAAEMHAAGRKTGDQM
jgi:CDP-4-dehydro-6-deoxyglucose reductase/ferredoxin-NAD(P)+ reductase (naphthalene dioxygenase ferredoxin-specific)